MANTGLYNLTQLLTHRISFVRQVVFIQYTKHPNDQACLDKAAKWHCISWLNVSKILGKTAHNTFSPKTTKDVACLLKSYAQKYGLPQPAAPTARPEAPPIYLPCGSTKHQIHKTYMESALSERRIFVMLQTFKDLWQRTCPDNKIMSRREDCCAKCELMRDAVMKATTDSAKKEALQQFESHMNSAYEKRHRYNQCIADAKEGKITHLIFDFAKQLTIPSTRQVGPMYFKVARRVRRFGICNIATPMQTNYLADENHTIGPDEKKAMDPMQ